MLSECSLISSCYLMLRFPGFIHPHSISYKEHFLLNYSPLVKSNFNLLKGCNRFETLYLLFLKNVESYLMVTKEIFYFTILQFYKIYIIYGLHPVTGKFTSIYKLRMILRQSHLSISIVLFLVKTMFFDT